VFSPHVVLAYCHRTVRLFNSDPVFHNVHGYAVRGWYSLFNVGMPRKGYLIDKTVKTPGPIILKCDAGHRWMTSYIYAAENPYVALTGPDGRFVIDGVPPGSHRVKVWHETLGDAEFSLEIKPTATTTLNLRGCLEERPRFGIDRSQSGSR
jgi:hypothetical protein